MSNEIAVEVKNLSKQFRLPTEQASGLKQAVLNRFKGIKGYKEQKVLRGISFTVEKGDFFGIVGRNGSGKSTLLKLISGIYEPDGGSIKINGSLVSFIELGVGFNGELTGRENVYLNGALVGFSVKEIDAMYNEIVEFAELQDFMDQKLKNYSSGMQVRLAFACAIRAKSGILVLDEVLAVGDEAFQRKCNDYFEKVRKDSNQTVILVTHSMDAVKRYCNKAIMILDGKITKSGPPEDVANEYSIENLTSKAKINDESQKVNAQVRDFKVKLLSSKEISQEETIRIEVSYTLNQDTECFMAAVLQDVDRNVVVIIRETPLKKHKANEHAKYTTCIGVSMLNDSNLRVLCNIRRKNHDVIAYYPEQLSPTITLRRTDYPTKRITDSVLYDYQKWEKNE